MENLNSKSSTNSYTKRYIGIMLFIVSGIIAYLSLKTPTGEIGIRVNDKVGHTLAYFILTINLGLLLQKKNSWIAGIITFSYSALLEYFQGYVPGRTVSSLDLLANFSGAILGVLALYFLHHRILKLLDKFKFS